MSALRELLGKLSPDGVRELLAGLDADELNVVEEMLADDARSSFASFIRQAWPLVEPGTPLRWGWHLDAICAHLEAVADGRIKDLLVNVPPGHAKSLLVSVFWPAWLWARAPEKRIIGASYAEGLAVRDAVKARSIVDSEWFQRAFVRGAWSLSDDMNAKSYYQNTRQGFRVATGVGGKSTGLRADVLIVDDPLSAPDAFSKAKRDEVLRWWTQAFANRVADPQTAARVLIMQRLHEEDLAGHVLAAGGWDHLCLPSLYEPGRSRSSIGWQDPRTTEGELLFPSMFGADVIAGERKRLGEVGFAGQHQQRPNAAEGGLFRRGWWRFWRFEHEPEIPSLAARTVILPERFEAMALSWDLSFKGSAASDFVAGGAWGRVGANKFLLDLTWKRMSFTETLAAIQAQAAKYPRARAKLVEDAANGPAVIDALRGKLSGLIAVRPEGGKESRAAATSPDVEAGNVYLPLHAPWREAYIEECAIFPAGAHDDAVDQMTQLLNRWSNARSGLERLRRLCTGAEEARRVAGPSSMPRDPFVPWGRVGRWNGGGRF